MSKEQGKDKKSEPRELTDRDVILIFLDFLERSGVFPEVVLKISETESNFNELLSQVNALSGRIDYILQRHPFLNSLLLQLTSDLTAKLRDVKVITKDNLIQTVFDSITVSNMYLVLSDMVYEALRYGNSFGYLIFDDAGRFVGIEPLSRTVIQKLPDNNYSYDGRTLDVNYVIHLSFFKAFPFLKVGIPLYYYALTTAERAAMLEDLYILLRLLRGIPIKKIILNLKKNYTDQEIQMLKTKLKEKLYYQSLIDQNGQINLFNTLKVFDTVFMEMQMDGQKIVDFEILELKGVDSIQDDEILFLLYNKLYTLIPVPSYYKELVFRNTRMAKVVEATGEYTNKLAIEKQDYAYNKFLENIFNNVILVISKVVIVSLLERRYYNFDFEVRSLTPGIIDIMNTTETLNVTNEFIASFLTFHKNIVEVNKVAYGHRLEFDWSAWLEKIRDFMENVNIRLAFVSELGQNTQQPQQQESDEQLGNIFESAMKQKPQLVISTTPQQQTEESRIFSNRGNMFLNHLIVENDIKLKRSG